MPVLHWRTAATSKPGMLWLLRTTNKGLNLYCSHFFWQPEADPDCDFICLLFSWMMYKTEIISLYGCALDWLHWDFNSHTLVLMLVLYEWLAWACWPTFFSTYDELVVYFYLLQRFTSLSTIITLLHHNCLEMFVQYSKWLMGNSDTNCSVAFSTLLFESLCMKKAYKTICYQRHKQMTKINKNNSKNSKTLTTFAFNSYNAILQLQTYKTTVLSKNITHEKFLPSCLPTEFAFFYKKFMSMISITDYDGQRNNHCVLFLMLWLNRNHLKWLRNK